MICTDPKCTRAHYSTRVHIEGDLRVPSAIDITIFTGGADVDEGGSINSTSGKGSEQFCIQLGADEETMKALFDVLEAAAIAFVAEHRERIIFSDGLEIEIDCGVPHAE